MYKSKDLVYLNTGDYEYVVQISELLEDNKYRILNGIFRAIDVLPPDPPFDLQPPTYTIPEPYKIEDEPKYDLKPFKFEVNMWHPIKLIYPHVKVVDKEKFDIEDLDEIRRYADSLEFETYISMLGSYDSSWKDGIDFYSSSIPAAEKIIINVSNTIPISIVRQSTNKDIISVPTHISSTQDCKVVLNSNLGDKNWKRVFKFGIEDTESIRCFSGDDGTMCYIGYNGDGFYIHVNPPITKQDVEYIRTVGQWYHTHDYGDMYYNPWDKTLLISGGDGGYIFSKTKVNEDALSEFDFDSFVEFNTHPETSFIDNVIWADEYTPDQLDEDDGDSTGFFWVGRINLFDE